MMWQFTLNQNWWKAVGQMTSMLGVVRSECMRNTVGVAFGRSFSWKRSLYGKTTLSVWQCLKDSGKMLQNSSRRCQSSLHRSPLLMYGVAAFLWEREKISNESIKSCLKSYEERVKSGCTTDSSLCPLPETGAVRSLHTSSFWTSVTFGWLRANDGSQEETPSSKDSRNVESQTAKPDEKKMKRDLLISELTEQYREHTERQLSQLPLVGLIGNQGSKCNGFISKLVKKTQRTLFTLGAAHHTAAMDQILGISHDEVVHHLVEGCESFSDLACIDMALQSPSPLAADGDGFNFELSFGPASETKEPSLYPLVGIYRRESTGVLDNLIFVLGLNRATRNFFHLFDQILGLDFEPEWTLVNQANNTINYWSTQVLMFVRKSLNIDKNYLPGQPVPRHSVTLTEPKVEANTTDYLSDWELFVKEQSCLVYRKPYGDTGLYQFKVIGTYSDVTAKDFYEVQFNKEARLSWDVYTRKLQTVDFDPISGCKVVHWIMKFPFPLSSREYVYVHKSWISGDEDAIISVSKSVLHPSVPESRSVVRVKDYYSEIVIKAHTYIDEPGLNYELTYFDDPQICLPSSAVSWVATSAMPDYLSKVHKAALTRQSLTQQFAL